MIRPGALSLGGPATLERVPSFPRGGVAKLDPKTLP